ncbi:PhzF family phenazine biosynthesis protein [candidate division WOR-3 bacterium]|nr:PhzF family phenazine biosynthesis protein [candidate division WOR-3 bacterium]
MAGLEFLVLDVFARERFQGNQLAVFPHAAGTSDRLMQDLAREMHFSETTFILDNKPNERGWPVRIFTPAREVPFAGHPTLGTAWTIWDRFLGRRADSVLLDLKVGVVPVEIHDGGERLVMTQVSPEFGDACPHARAARALGLEPGDIDGRFPCREVSTGLWFLIVPVRTLAAMKRIRINRAEYERLAGKMRAKAVLAFCPETEDPECRLHVRVFCEYYDVPEDPATGSANGCLCAWLVRERFFGTPAVELATEQGIEIGRPSRLLLDGREQDGRIAVRVGGRVVPVGRGVIG